MSEDGPESRSRGRLALGRFEGMNNQTPVGRRCVATASFDRSGGAHSSRFDQQIERSTSPSRLPNVYKREEQNVTFRLSSKFPPPSSFVGTFRARTGVCVLNSKKRISSCRSWPME